jgi:hypothetical protein
MSDPLRERETWLQWRQYPLFPDADRTYLALPVAFPDLVFSFLLVLFHVLVRVEFGYAHGSTAHRLDLILGLRRWLPPLAS